MSLIEVFADVRCPFTHVGLRRLVERREDRGGGPTLLVRAWPLELVNGGPMDAALIGEEIRAIRAQVAPDLFGGFEAARFPASSLPGLALTAAAYRHGAEVGEAVALALRWSMFEEGRDIADRIVLAELAAAHGVEVTPDDEVQVRADWEEGRGRGVIGSPHFVLGSDGFFCPGLDISHDQAGFHIRSDVEAFDAFAARALAE